MSGNTSEEEMKQQWSNKKSARNEAMLAERNLSKMKWSNQSEQVKQWMKQLVIQAYDEATCEAINEVILAETNEETSI